MDQTVALLVAAVCLFGTALGLRFSVYVLIPAGLAVLIVSGLAADLEQDGRMGNAWYARPANPAECRFCSWVVSARGSGLLVHSEDCATVRASGQPRPTDASARWRRTRVEQRRMRADGYNYAPRLGKREFPSITPSAVPYCIFSGHLAVRHEQSCVLHDDDFAWR